METHHLRNGAGVRSNASVRASAVLVAACLMAASLTSSDPATAHKGATGVVKARMDGMKAMAEALKTTGAMARGLKPYDAAVVTAAARVLSRHSQALMDLFPQGSDHAPSKALPEVWTDRDRFMKSATSLQQAATQLEQMATDVSQLGQIVKKIGAVCSQCHKRFRAPDS